MDSLSAMRLLVRVVERRSFSAAAKEMGIPRSTATTAIKELEQRLGVRLLERTTRHVVPTPEGEAYRQRCVAILGDVEEAENAFRPGRARGTLHVDTNGHLARTLILPELPAFLAAHPELSLHLGEGDRLVDLVREGVDLVIRAGELASSDLVVRRLGTVGEITCASPGYLARHGVPRTPDDLAGHLMVGFVSSRTGQVLPLEFTVGSRVREIVLPARVTSSSSEMTAALARLGFGLVQAPRFRFAEDLASGRLVEVLGGHPPTPITLSVLYLRSRQRSPRVRVFVDWLFEVLKPRLERLS